MDLIYILHDDAGEEQLNIRGETHKYLVKVRRHLIGDAISFRNPNDIKILHKYEIVDLDARVLSLKLLESSLHKVKSKKNLHIAWCMIDAKSIEKVLPSLSEIGVEKISFIACDRSQKNFKLDFKRFHRILEASMQQCGRSSYIEFDIYKNIKDFIKEFPETKVFDFCQNTLKDSNSFQTILIGCEGGFSQNERELLKSQEVFKLDTPMILRSESAVMAVSSKILL